MCSTDPYSDEWVAAEIAKFSPLALDAFQTAVKASESLGTWEAYARGFEAAETASTFAVGPGTLLKAGQIRPVPASPYAMKADPLGASVPTPLNRPMAPGGGEPIPGPGTFRPLPQGVYRRIPFNTRNIQSVMLAQMNAAQPRVVRWLVSTVNAERDAIKFEELRNALATGEVPPDWIRRWRRSYTDLINQRIAPEWDVLHARSQAHMNQRWRSVLGVSGPDPILINERLRAWTTQHAAELAVGFTDTQATAVQRTLTRFIANEQIGAAELGRVLRPMIGLTPNQATAVANFQSALTEGGVTGETFWRRVDAYAGRLLRVRAERIARTELAFAWNQSAIESIRAGITEGLIAPDVYVYKVFMTAKDEAVCPFCEPLNGQVVGLEETFPGRTARVPNAYMPPLHPSCRCTVGFELDAPVPI